MRRSLDGGETWGRIQVVASDGVHAVQNPTAVVDRETGTIRMVLIRTDNVLYKTQEDLANSKTRTRSVWVVCSKDEGETWSDVLDDPNLVEPVCQASILRYTTSDAHGKNRLLFSNPATRDARVKMTVKMSYDEGKSWPVSKLLHPGPCAYSCLTVLPDMTIGCLYESGENDPVEEITFARFTVGWLTDGEDRLVN